MYTKNEECLEVYNKSVFDIVYKYINSKIDLEELKSCLEWNFQCKNNYKKEYFNEIFPELIEIFMFFYFVILYLIIITHLLRKKKII